MLKKFNDEQLSDLLKETEKELRKLDNLLTETQNLHLAILKEFVNRRVDPYPEIGI